MQNASMFDWNDLRFYLAVARTGSTLAAARRLRVSQTTVARRIEALEAALGLKLFERRRSGYLPTELAKGLFDAAEQAETALASFETKAQEQIRTLTGTVRLTTNELFAEMLLVGLLREFRALHPGLKLEIITADRSLDLARGEADVALRASLRPSQPSLIGRRLAKDGWSVYCSRDYDERYGRPHTEDDLAQHALVGIEPGQFSGPVAAWLRDRLPEAAVVLRRNGPSGLVSAIRAGLGVSMAPDLVARLDPDFVYCFTPDIEQPYEIWLITHERLRGEPRIRAVMDFFSERLPIALRDAGGRPREPATHAPLADASG